MKTGIRSLRYGRIFLCSGGILLSVCAVIVSGVVSRGAVSPDTLFNLSNVSPNGSPWGSQYIEIGNTSSAGYTSVTGGDAVGARHVIRHTGQGDNSELQLSVHAPRGTAVATVYFTDLSCKFDFTNADNKVPPVDNVHNLKVFINGSATPSYDVPAERGKNANDNWRDPSNAKPCQGSTSLEWLDDTNTALGRRLFTVPLSPDPKTGKATGSITIKLDGGSTGAPQNAIWLRAVSDNGTLLSIAPNTSAGGYGLNLGGNRGIKGVIPFGLACTETADRAGIVQMYDPDPSFGRQDISVYERAPGDNNVNNWRVLVNHQEIVPGNLATHTSSINMRPGYQYILVFYNPNSGNTNPAGNTIGLRVPTDSIYGVINCRYNLRPSISIDKNVFTVSTNLNPQAGITNDADAVGSDHEWRVSKTVFNNRPNMDGESFSDEAPCVFMNGKNGGASGIATDGACESVGGSLNYPDTQAWSNSGATGDTPVGYYVCYMTSVKDPTWASSDNDQWRHSNLVCAVSGKQPKVHVTGHDLRVGGTINTSTTIIDSKLYSSWGEYGVFSGVCNQDGRMTSGSVNSGNDGGTPGNMSTAAYHPLTFANVLKGTCPIGNYGGLPEPNVEAYKEGESEGSLSGGVKEIGSISGTKKVYYYPNATVHITQDLAYGNSYTAVNKIPRILIIAKDIVIDDNVERIDAWLLASDRISTCRQYGLDAVAIENNYSYAKGVADLTSGKCSKPLKFNGPVIADSIYLLRTHGSGKDEEEEAAETFNLRADAFLSTYSGSLGQPVATTDDIDELPPRF